MKRKQKRDQAKTKAKKIYFFIIICHKSNKRDLKIFYWNNSIAALRAEATFSRYEMASEK